MGQMDAGLIAGCRIIVERKRLARNQINRAVLEPPDPELGSLQVRQDADRPPEFGLDTADSLNERAHQIVIGMAHIDAEDIGACLEEPADHRLFRGGRSQRRQYLDLAGSSHWLADPVVGVVSGGDSSVSWTIQLDCTPVSYSWKPTRW